jgi:hypothetical protein
MKSKKLLPKKSLKLTSKKSPSKKSSLDSNNLQEATIVGTVKSFCKKLEKEKSNKITSIYRDLDRDFDDVHTQIVVSCISPSETFVEAKKELNKIKNMHAVCKKDNSWTSPVPLDVQLKEKLDTAEEKEIENIIYNAAEENKETVSLEEYLEAHKEIDSPFKIDKEIDSIFDKSLLNTLIESSKNKTDPIIESSKKDSEFIGVTGTTNSFGINTNSTINPASGIINPAPSAGVFVNNDTRNYSTDWESTYKSALLKSLKPIQQWTDLELLNKFATDRDLDSEQELHRRSRGQHFIALKPGKNIPQVVQNGSMTNLVQQEAIDITLSLELLKNSRKRTNPSIVPGPDGRFLQIYKVMDLNMANRIIDLCPFCVETLWKDYCVGCNVMLDGIGSDELQLLNFIWIHLKKGNIPIQESESCFKKRLIAYAQKSTLERTATLWEETFGQNTDMNSLINQLYFPSTVGDIDQETGKYKIIYGKPYTDKSIGDSSNNSLPIIFFDLKKKDLLPKLRIVARRPSTVIGTDK